MTTDNLTGNQLKFKETILTKLKKIQYGTMRLTEETCLTLIGHDVIDPSE